MAEIAPRTPEQFRSRDDEHNDFTVSELMSEASGAHSPFGDVEYPVPADALFYEHPSAADRPNLADGR